jgi:DNA invertase Pin-like site-specific DNA recombinase
MSDESNTNSNISNGTETTPNIILKKRRIINNKQRNEIIKLFNENVSISAIATLVHLPVKTVYSIVAVYKKFNRIECKRRR